MLMTIARKLVGAVILATDKITSPTGPNRTEQEQALFDKKTSNITIYEMLACPYCVKVRREIKRLGLNINRLDVKQSVEAMENLVNGGGKFQVPCLKIQNDKDIQWMYESDDIIDFLRKL